MIGERKTCLRHEQESLWKGENPMEKKPYEELEFQTIRFEAEDIIRTSGGQTATQGQRVAK